MTRMAAVALGVVLAGCSGDFGTNEKLLTPADVQGVYRICSLRFTPVQTALPAVDLLARVIDANPAPPAQGASITLSGSAPEFEIVYTHRGDAVLRQARGDMEFGAGSVFLYVTSQTPTIIQQEALLPPSHLDLVFHASPRSLSAGDEVSAYFVRRSDYTHAAGMSEEGLADRIQGHVSALFSAGACG
ncbi:MAG TPA: hypothetical protein VJT67_09515 [Longimicrobiaceae bacterium]|nr:hypothetical protein [Longimicrobiaceae bacterium]